MFQRIEHSKKDRPKNFKILDPYRKIELIVLKKFIKEYEKQTSCWDGGKSPVLVAFQKFYDKCSAERVLSIAQLCELIKLIHEHGSDIPDKMKKPWADLVRAIGKEFIDLMDFYKLIDGEIMNFMLSHPDYLVLLEYFQKYFNNSTYNEPKVVLFFLQDFLKNGTDEQHEELIANVRFLCTLFDRVGSGASQTYPIEFWLGKISEDWDMFIKLVNFYRFLEENLLHTPQIEAIRPHHIVSILRNRETGPKKISRLGNLILMIETCFPNYVQNKGNLAYQYFQLANTIVERFPKEREVEVIATFGKICCAVVQAKTVKIEELYTPDLLHSFDKLCFSNDFFNKSQQILAAVVKFQPGKFPPYKIIPELMTNPDSAAQLVSAVNLMNGRGDIDVYDTEAMITLFTKDARIAMRTAECLHVLLKSRFASSFVKKDRQYDFYEEDNKLVLRPIIDPAQIEETNFIAKIASFENGVTIAQALIQFEKEVADSVDNVLVKAMRETLLKEEYLPRAKYIVETIVYLKNAHCFADNELLMLNCLLENMKNINENTAAKVKQLFDSGELTLLTFRRECIALQSGNVVQLGIYAKEQLIAVDPGIENDIELEVVFHG